MFSHFARAVNTGYATCIYLNYYRDESGYFHAQVTEWRNIAKTTVWFSSKMEKFMIQMTWPDDGVLDDVWVKVSVGSDLVLVASLMCTRVLRSTF